MFRPMARPMGSDSIEKTSKINKLSFKYLISGFTPWLLTLPPLYNLHQLSTLVAAIRHGWRIEVGQPGRLTQPTRRQSRKLRLARWFSGQVVWGGLFLGTLFWLLKKEYLACGCEYPLPLKYHDRWHDRWGQSRSIFVFSK